ncbi:hypothetical protein AcV7_005362 [Taiwanofungus camphoratus]|nr:hypothetical protein AcV7_005362 [Antrodia cinnamomea]
MHVSLISINTNMPEVNALSPKRALLSLSASPIIGGSNEHGTLRTSSTSESSSAGSDTEGSSKRRFSELSIGVHFSYIPSKC